MEPPQDVDPIEAARQRYRVEREKRLRDDGLDQYAQLAGEYEALDHDPWVEPGFTRDPIVEDTDAVIVGGGFAGMMLSVNLLRRGITDFRMVEKAGDFGGTWYWNRYPGCLCDVESYIYMPFLEETGYMPTQRYAPATEIFEHCQRIGRHFDLYPHALFQTEVAGAEWDDEAQRWEVTTTRGDRLRARFLVTAGGILHKAKLPAIPGINDFEGKAFHTARWDYGYTGGSPTEPMDRPGRQAGGDHRHRRHRPSSWCPSWPGPPRRCSSSSARRPPSACGPTDPPTSSGSRPCRPGWQTERMRNFTAAVTGEQPDQDMVGDGWTEVLWTDTQTQAETPEGAADLERADFETMESLRARIDEVIDDPETAERMKPWYGKHCKRICFHDDYLQAFNQPNVHLVDTDGRGVQEIGPSGPIVDGEAVRRRPAGVRLRLRGHHRAGQPARVRPRSAATACRSARPGPTGPTPCTACSATASPTCW